MGNKEDETLKLTEKEHMLEKVNMKLNYLLRYYFLDYEKHSNDSTIED